MKILDIFQKSFNTIFVMKSKVADAECLEATTSSMLPHFPKIQ